MRMLARSLAAGAAVAALSLPLAAHAEKFTLRVASGHPSGPSVYVSLVEKLFVPEVKKRVKERTKHEVDFVEGYGGAIVKVAETLEAVENGLIDIGAYCFCFEPAKLFLHNFPYYAPFGPQDSDQAMKVTRAVYNRFPVLTEVFEKQYKQKLLGLSGWDNYHLGTVKEWNKVSDLKGVKVGGAGPNLPWIEYAGAVPVQSTLPEGYMSLQNGVYSGWLMFPSAYFGFKFYEPAPYYTLIGFGAVGVNGLTINLNTFRKLPKEIQDILVEVGRLYEEESGKALNAAQAKGLENLEKSGKAVIKKLPEDTRVEWAKSLSGFPVKMAKEADGKGLPGTAVMRAYLEEMEKAGYKPPVRYEIR